jgi:hypothetical protein
MAIVAYARALFGGGSTKVATQADNSGALTPSQIAPAPGAFPWAMMVSGIQHVRPVLASGGSIGPQVGRWGGVQYLGPAQIPQPAINPAYTACQTGIRNIYGPGFASVPYQAPVPQVVPEFAGQPHIVTPKIALNPAFTDYINHS